MTKINKIIIPQTLNKNGLINFFKKKGLELVIKRAEAMHLACEMQHSTMAAIIGLESHIIKEACKEQSGIVVIANYNTPNQIVISGEEKTIIQHLKWDASTDSTKGLKTVSAITRCAC